MDQGPERAAGSQSTAVLNSLVLAAFLPSPPVACAATVYAAPGAKAAVEVQVVLSAESLPTTWPGPGENGNVALDIARSEFAAVLTARQARAALEQARVALEQARRPPDAARD